MTSHPAAVLCKSAICFSFGSKNVNKKTTATARQAHCLPTQRRNLSSQFIKATLRRVLSRRSERTQLEFHSSPSSSLLKPTRIASSRPEFNRRPGSSILGLVTWSAMLHTAMAHQQHRPRVSNLLRDTSISALAMLLLSPQLAMSRRDAPRSHR